MQLFFENAVLCSMSLDKLTNQQALMPMMGKLMKELHAHITSELKAHNINLNKEQTIVLKYLLEEDGRPQNDLALVTSRDKTSLTRLLTTMETKKLIKRKQSSIDRRINLVYITKKGLAEIELATPVMINFINKAINGIDEHRIEETKLLIQDIYQNLQLPYER